MDVNLDWASLLSFLLRIAAAFVLTLPIAWERERETRIMGLRTFPLVAVGSCGYALVAIAVVGVNEDAQARIIQGLITGIGFIGGGAILKKEEAVQGTATAASIWSTGIIGAATAYGQYEIAIVISLINYLTLRLLTPLQNNMIQEDELHE